MIFLRIILSITWALPFTILGLLLSLILFCTRLISFYHFNREYAAFVWVWRSPFLLKLFDGKVSGFTLGNSVFIDAGALSRAVVDHELCHVGQFYTWGLLFLFMYAKAAVGNTAFVLFGYVDGYWWYYNSRFEVEAREFSAQRNA